MLTGNDPVDGAPLLRMGGVPSGRGAVPGFDLTFSAPKSVSLLWALGDGSTQAAVRDAHERSVDAALAYMQRDACWTRRGKGGAEFVHGYIAAAFRHRSSRAGDPQLHTHVLIANATKGPDQRWTRLYHPAIYDHAKTAGYVCEAQLRHELSRSLGVRWQSVRHGIAELSGLAWLGRDTSQALRPIEAQLLSRIAPVAPTNYLSPGSRPAVPGAWHAPL